MPNCCVAIFAVTRFARATGDMHSLSAVDVKLLALAYTLEAATHGTSHLKASRMKQASCTGVQVCVRRSMPGCTLCTAACMNAR
jgi:rRNA maturation endonuclease Nob1